MPYNNAKPFVGECEVPTPAVYGSPKGGADDATTQRRLRKPGWKDEAK